MRVVAAPRPRPAGPATGAGGRHLLGVVVGASDDPAHELDLVELVLSGQERRAGQQLHGADADGKHVHGSAVAAHAREDRQAQVRSGFRVVVGWGDVACQIKMSHGSVTTR